MKSHRPKVHATTTLPHSSLNRDLLGDRPATRRDMVREMVPDTLLF